MDGQPPDGAIAAACGWERIEVFDRAINAPVPSWERSSRAERIGWIDDVMVYLEPNASFKAVEAFAPDGAPSGNQKGDAYAIGGVRADQVGSTHSG